MLECDRGRPRHLLTAQCPEQGRDISYIQGLLGHESPNTIMIYTHVGSVNMRNIKNLLDFLLSLTRTSSFFIVI